MSAVLDYGYIHTYWGWDQACTFKIIKVQAL